MEDEHRLRALVEFFNGPAFGGEQGERISLQPTSLNLIVPVGAGAAYAQDSSGNVLGLKFGISANHQQLLELALEFPRLERLVFFADSKEPIEIPPSIGDLNRLRFAFFSGNIRKIPEEILRLDIPLFVGRQSSDIEFTGRALRDRLDVLTAEAQKVITLKGGLKGDELQLFLSSPEFTREILAAQTAKIVGVVVDTDWLEDPPLEIAARGREAIASYFRDRGQGALRLNEVKVLLVGNGGCGKTSLVKQISGDKFDPTESQTHGIRITKHSLGSKKEGRIKANFWDFGGQEIMHATHQFFLSKRSLYVLVLDGRKEEDPEYWLQYIQSFGGDSPVIVVLNKIDEHPAFDVNRRFLVAKYPMLVGFFRVSCSSGAGVLELRSAMHKQLISATILQTKWPIAWFKVKQRLEGLNSNYISMNEYHRICDEVLISEQTSKDALVDFLNDLGVILHFKDLQLLDTHVLDPRWVTEGVYTIVNSKVLAKQKGLMRISQLKDVFSASKATSEFEYSPDKFNFIVELMLKFELCYRLENNAILVPDLLGIQEPPLNTDSDSALRFVFEYQYLPKSIMPRFIVRMHKDIKGDNAWRTGVQLEDKSLGSIAIVRADDKAKRIYIEVTGAQKRDYFAALRKTIADVNASFERLEVTQFVPLYDHPEVLIEYQELIGHELAGREQMFVGKLARDYSVQLLLDGIEAKTSRQMHPAQTIIHFQGSYINQSTGATVTTAIDNTVGGVETAMNYQPQIWEKILSYGVALLIVIAVLFLVVRNQPIADPNLAVILRVVLSVAMAILGASVPGLI